MPQAILQSSPELSIVLDKGTTFIGGETIRGHVIRKSPLVDPDSSVLVRVNGRTKVKIRFNSGMTHREYRSCFSFFGGSSEVHKSHQGPIHIPPNSPEKGRWPFAIALPKHPNLASLKRNNEDERSYLSLSDVSSQGLPPTFYVRAHSLGRVVEGYVEYHLEATLLSSGKKNSGKQDQATQPLCVRPISSPIPITDFDPKHRSEFKQRIVSQRLVPGMDSKIPVGQRIKKILGSSQIPAYSFSLQLDFAAILQIGNPNTIPLRLRVKPMWEDTSEILRKKPQMIIVKQFTLTLLSTTHYTSKRLRPDELQDTSSLILANYTWRKGPKEAYKANATPPKDQADAPPSADTLFVPQDNTSPPIDLGIALGIQTPMSSKGAEIYPTFTTYNIKNEHHLEWKLAISIAGEIAKYEGKQPVTVMGPSSSL
ncbi:hypothetical protein N7474_007827 [Penicillium riverlandense]|uniref:uncharacterized protein n=1 Tax=Penicillium riverlandense TaxID=1903569 RepID=UPI0025489B46|nr:uncharacterized protein N7474_007827 [Penicillium riverlandense]KAJ5811526.1 hypothetical protein N7474_007827 [Penicillium riverlandense]